MKHIIIAALFAASIIAAEPDWGKVIDQQNKHHHDDHGGGHHSPVPEPGTWVLIGAGMLGLAAWKRRKGA